MLILMSLVGLAMFICYIVVLIRVFKVAGPGHGFVSIIVCGLWAFVWGWINAAKQGLTKIMIIWTGLMILYITLGLLGGFADLSARSMR
ncbi:MAG TPA: hypothetical protein VN345_07680 [Blastocatellia bacterium]|jgi:hypothetical protein|nr:hypothetical protein [Blastocatellia bacterium]